MRLSHPPSRLSPPPGTSVHDLLQAGTRDMGNGNGGVESASGSAAAAAAAKRKEEERVPKRGYRACVHCRLRKAKCDLGDVNAPSEPPCTRCRREQRNCVFLPSKRRRRTLQDDDPPEIYPSALTSMQQAPSSISSFHPPALPATITASGNIGGLGPSPTNASTGGASGSSGIVGTNEWIGRPQMPGQVDVVDPLTVFRASSANTAGATTSGGAGGAASSNGTAGAPPSWSDNLTLFETKLSPLFDPPSNATSVPESSLGSVSTSSPNNPSRRRRQHHPNEPDATRRIVVANFSNETDALEILAKAATDTDGDQGTGKEEERVERKRVAWADSERPRLINDFVLIKRGVLNEQTLELLVQVFFQRHHPVLPIFQTARIPSNKQQLATLAHEDPFLLSAIVCVASRHHLDAGMRDVHDQTYALIRETIADYSCAGLQPSVGFVEGILLLAENLPRDRLALGAAAAVADMVGPTEDGPGLHGIENRRSWALTGTAIRAAYGLGLDQIAMDDEGERTAQFERARGVWTWCYLYDRTIGLRTGLAFWSRGPSICFNGYSHISQTGEAAAHVNFPYMMTSTKGDLLSGTSAAAASPNALVDTNDSASLMQAQMELTQIMTNAHDILFSTRARTSALVKKGEYFKFLDHFRRALDSFRAAWKDKVWRLDSVRELTWCTYHFVRLYVAAFAFQAHVQRAQDTAEHEREQGRAGVVSLFPRGSATSPDALYVYESIDAAHEILNICVRLGSSGALRYLPTRFLINFAYSGTFALKAAYSGAVAKTDTAKTTELVDRVCAAMLLACPDKDHPACRYGQMLRMLSRRLSELSDQSAVPSRFPSPEPSAATEMPLLPMQLSNFDSSINVSTGDQTGALSTTTNDPGPALFDLDHVPPGLFDVDLDLDVGFNLDGFWEDFTLTDSGGFPFR